MADRDEWSGTPTELFGVLNEVAERLKIDTRQKEWPKDPRWVSRRMKEIKTNLLEEGIMYDRGKGDKREISIRRVSQEDLAK